MDGSPPPAKNTDPPETELPAGFTPLRLRLQPGGLCLELDRPDMVVGRHSSADVRLCLPDVSRRHCRCVFADRRWKLIDLGSLNGTFVNGRRREEATVAHGDTVGIGSLVFGVELETMSPTVVLPGREQPGHGERILRHIADALPGDGNRRQAS